MKHLFIINPVAGGRKNRSKTVEAEIRSLMDGRNADYEIYYTTAPMDACLKVRSSASGCKNLRVYACGGDGTLNECVNGAAGNKNVSVTHYPCGTGNDFVKMFGKSDERKFKALPELIDGFVRPLDIIDCSGRYGINICSAGIDARIGTDVHKYSGIPIIGGATGYVVSLIINMIKGINSRFKVTLPGTIIDDDLSLICACNGRYYGGGFNPVPEAMPDDGLMDVLVAKGISRVKVPSMIGKYAKGRYRELPDIITYHATDCMELSSSERFVVNIDGEAVWTDSITFKLIPEGVNFIFPKSMQFFSFADETDSKIAI